ncbi:colanic acid exporter [Citrobacter braakii]|nr:colanic acid exporter [Citrobacter braakii]
MIIALADTLSDFGIANSIIQRKDIGYLELTTLYWLNVGLGMVVCVAMFLLSGTIASVLNNPETGATHQNLIAGVCGDTARAAVSRADAKKSWPSNKIGMIETSSVLAGFTFTRGQRPFLAARADGHSRVSGEQYATNAAVRLFWVAGFTVRDCIFRWHPVSSNLRFGAWLTADSIINYLNTNLSTLVFSQNVGRRCGGRIQSRLERGGCSPDQTEPDYYPVSCFRRLPKFRTTVKSYG